jgi:hypothetical protein
MFFIRLSKHSLAIGGNNYGIEIGPRIVCVMVPWVGTWQWLKGNYPTWDSWRAGSYRQSFFSLVSIYA